MKQVTVIALVGVLAAGMVVAFQAHRRQVATEHGEDQVGRDMRGNVVVMQREIQARNAIGDRGHRAQIVADKNDGEFQILLQ